MARPRNMPPVPGTRLNEEALRDLRTSLYHWTEEDLILVAGCISEQLQIRWGLSGREATARLVSVLDLTGANLDEN